MFVVFDGRESYYQYATEDEARNEFECHVQVAINERDACGTLPAWLSDLFIAKVTISTSIVNGDIRINERLEDA